MTREFEMRLVGHDAGDGELLAGDAVNLIGAFREVVYRLTRAAADRAGLGRTDSAVERLAQVRFALRSGGTRLVFTVGDPHSLDIDPHSGLVEDTFWRIARAMATNRRPEGVSDSVAEAVDQLLVAFTKAATTVELLAPRRKPVVLTTRMLDRRPWQRSAAPARAATLEGTLEMVDLHTGRFRLRGPDGTAVDLIEVANAPVAASLVGRPVTATGVLAEGTGTRHHRMEGPVVATPGADDEGPGRVLPGQTSFDPFFGEVLTAVVSEAADEPEDDVAEPTPPQETSLFDDAPTGAGPTAVASPATEPEPETAPTPRRARPRPVDLGDTLFS